MYGFLLDISTRPEPFSRYTAKALWTKPHLSQQMLEFHLNQDTDLASRRFGTIDRVVRWINTKLPLAGKSLCDLGCGPGLYTQRFANHGAKVTGVDFSDYTLNYARSTTDENIDYIHVDYLNDELPYGFDIITLIYTDLCVLSPDQRKQLLSNMRSMLNPGGHIVLDVAGVGLLKQRTDITLIETRLMGGFWAEGDYVGIQKSFTYPEQNLALDRYIIVEPTETWEIYNWFQHFTPESIKAELQEVGFSTSTLAGDLTGKPLVTDGDLIGVIATLI